ncbi:conserved hypothetical protein [Leishmania major strain Friedlin]|uniref:Uncharacterized protein n=1 Tax=Leishmania major TaxID=5664 RepID=Q4QAD4_LEIMA|nr:conserved hypothetical protein [Leishmania major strain Friedlin]CAG9574678.1 hypothetical_protein_-_conserved [Leishmania major strain Friedlin]CAJ05311.1 conserved hypothetical protein [Leishmania major strain Friedlin]|eukprot:XP_001683714.1 conserved hypothetical protein [Leishmania major strain Friedlin]
MVAELKSELRHVSRSLVQARQQARMSEETCAELRRRCQGLETEKQGLRLELQEAQVRLQARQTQTEEQRREAAEAKLTVLSLTAERDELAAKVQEAWDRVAELSAELRRQETEMQRLQTGITAAQHSKELAMQQHSHVEQQLRILQEQLRAHETDKHASAAARQRLSAALQRALERLAELLSNVAYDYQRSLACESRGNEEGTASEMFARVTANGEADPDEAASTQSHAGSIPHVVLFPANSHSTSAPTEQALMGTRPLQRRGSSNESARAHAENVLHSAEAAVLGDLWGAEGLSQPSSASLHDGLSKVPASASADPAAVTPPERRPPSPSSSRQALVQSYRPSTSEDAAGIAEATSQLSAITTLADEASLRTALTPLLLALKHVATMLGNVRHERRRWVAEAMHFRQCYEEVQHRLEAAQHVSASQESQAEVSRTHMGALQRRVEQAEAALLEFLSEDMRRRGSLAQTLKCAEDWALIQHSVELLQVRHSELSKDLQLLQEQRQAASAVGIERMEQAACAAAAEVRYQQLNQQYRALKELVEATWSRASGDLPQMKSSERCAGSDTPVAPPTAQTLSSPPPLPPSSGHGAASAPLDALPTAANADAPVAAQSRSSSTLLHCTSMAPTTVSTSHQRGEKETRDPDVSPTHKDGSVRGGEASTAPSETASALSAVANGKTSTRVQPCVGQTSSQLACSFPSSLPTTVEVENRVHAHASAPAPLPRTGAPAINGFAGPSRFATPPNTAYVDPLSGPSSTAARPLMGDSAYDAERILLASHHRGQGRSWSSVVAAYPAPSPPSSSTARCASSDVVSPPGLRRSYVSEDTERGVANGAVDYSSMFTSEVLQVIEALDRRVSGALDRTLHV